MGDMGCFSFYPGKNLGAYGEGGMVTTDNPEFARALRMLRDWGAERKYEHVLKGYNFQQQFDRAIETDTDFIFITGWNGAGTVPLLSLTGADWQMLSTTSMPVSTRPKAAYCPSRCGAG